MYEKPCLTTAEWADRLSGTLIGNPSPVVRTAATLDEAGPDALSWAATPVFVKKIADSRAAAVLVHLDAEPPADSTVIKVKDPDLAMCDVLDWFSPPRDCVPPGVHSTAVVDDGASLAGAAIGAHVFVGKGAVIGAGTQIYPGCYIGGRVTIGRDCILWPGVVVREGTAIGDRVIVHPNSTIGGDGFGFLQRNGEHRKIPQIGTVVIEDDVEVGANCTIDRARSGITRVGRGTKIDNLVQIAHNVDIGEHCMIISQCALGGSAKLGHHVILAGQVGVRDHHCIGPGSMVSTKSVVLTDVEGGKIVGGIPAYDQAQYLRASAAVRRLPEWSKRLRELAKRIDRLESRQADVED